MKSKVIFVIKEMWLYIKENNKALLVLTCANNVEV